MFGRQLTSDEFPREWKELNRTLLRLVPVRSPKRISPSHPIFHRLRVRRVEALTADSVVISFDVPHKLRATFGFQAGQHVTVRTDIGGTSVRRNYSICTPATEGGELAELAIGVRHIDGGAFSTFAVKGLKAGDSLDVMTPTAKLWQHPRLRRRQTLRGDRRRERDHADPVHAPNGSGGRAHVDFHVDLRQPRR